MSHRIGRRRLLALGAGAAAAGLVGGCGGTRAGSPARAGPPAEPRATRYPYGTLPEQVGDLYLPAGTARGTVVVVHGGFWEAAYTARLMVPICTALAGAGWAAWNLEYRRVGDGGGWPATLTDVAAGVDHLARLPAPRQRLAFLGHSAGGQLAVWAGSRTEHTPGGPPRITPGIVVSLAGVLDLAGAAAQGLGGGAIDALMGGTPAQVPEHYALGDPIALVPARAPVRCVRGRQDRTVPAAQSLAYVAAARRAGGVASDTVVPGDHSSIIDPSAPSWGTVLRQIHAG